MYFHIIDEDIPELHNEIGRLFNIPYQQVELGKLLISCIWIYRYSYIVLSFSDLYQG